MNVSIGERWEAFVEGVVRAGRYNTQDVIVTGGTLQITYN